MMRVRPRGEGERWYETIARLGTGAWLTAHLARQFRADRVSAPVVLLVAHDDPSNEHGDAHMQMLFDEGAWLSRRLDHPHLVQVLDTGTFERDPPPGAGPTAGAAYRAPGEPDARGGWRYFATVESLDAVTLTTLLRGPRGRAPLPPREVAAIGAHVAYGLAHLHEMTSADRQPLGAVYQAVRPDTVLVTRDGVARLVAPLLVTLERGSLDELRTVSGSIRGRLMHLAPEQVRGEQPTAQTDQFALGAVLWEALTGEPLFRRANDFESVRAISEMTAPPRAADRNPAVPAAFDDVLGKLLARSPADRFASVREAAALLERLARGPDGAEPAALALAARARARVEPASPGGFWPGWFGMH